MQFNYVNVLCSLFCICTQHARSQFISCIQFVYTWDINTKPTHTHTYTYNKQETRRHRAHSTFFKCRPHILQHYYRIKWYVHSFEYVWVRLRVCVCVRATGERMTACILVALAQHTMTTATATRAMTYIYMRYTKHWNKDKKKFAKKKTRTNKQIILTANSQPLNEIKIT